jgi:hypothetical protein
MEIPPCGSLSCVGCDERLKLEADTDVGVAASKPSPDMMGLHLEADTDVDVGVAASKPSPDMIGLHLEADTDVDVGVADLKP